VESELGAGEEGGRR